MIEVNETEGQTNRWDLLPGILRRTAKSHRDFANRLLSDSMQNRPEAKYYDGKADALDALAAEIESGRIWEFV